MMVMISHIGEYWIKNPLVQRSGRKYFEQPTFFGFYSDLYDTPFFNVAMYFRGKSPDTALEDLLSYFREKRKSFTLMTRVSDELYLDKSFLEFHGFEHRGTFIRMNLHISDLTVCSAVEDIVVLQVSEDEILTREICDIIFKDHPNLFSSVTEARETIISQLEVTDACEDIDQVDFVAYNREHQPLGIASLRYYDDLPKMAELSETAVISNSNRIGIYMTLLHSRAMHAQSHNKTHLYILAESISASMLRNFGFRDVEQVQLYHYDIAKVFNQE